MKSFALISDTAPVLRQNEHGGFGPITFRRILREDEFATNIDFVDATIIPSGSTIGRHEHADSEELYLIIKGSPLMRVQGEERRLSPGCISIVRPGESHELVNDTLDDVEIFVVQVHL
jgi:mannose-6-phosphate isomerase-like protein (cupin superfamily)